MTLSVVTIVTLLVFVVLGYQFNERDGRIEQGGLLQFASIPTGATVTLDDNRLGPRTNSKSNVAVGSHSVIFNRDGYRTWKKTISIKAGQIGWLSYARLIPSTVTPEPVRNFIELAATFPSPQRNFMLLQESIEKPDFILANIQGDTVAYAPLNFPADKFTQPSPGKSQSFSIESWSENEAAVLIKHTYDDTKVEWLFLDRNSQERSINISTTFGISPSKLVFAGRGDRLLFVQTDDSVRRINLDEQTLSRPLVSKVSSFGVYDDKTISYATNANDKGQRTIGYAATDISDPVTLDTYPDDGQPLFTAMSTYFGQRYIVTLHGQTLIVKNGTIPTKDSKGSMKTSAKRTVAAGVASLSLEHNSRFAVMQLPEGFATYDIELDKYDKTTWAVPSTTVRELDWIDEYMLWSDAGGMLRFYEFDGANQQNIMSVTEGYAVSLNPNGKYIYGILKNETGYVLQRATLIE